MNEVERFKARCKWRIDSKRLDDIEAFRKRRDARCKARKDADDDVIFRTASNGKVYAISESEGTIVGGLQPGSEGAKVGGGTTTTGNPTGGIVGNAKLNTKLEKEYGKDMPKGYTISTFTEKFMKSHCSSNNEIKAGDINRALNMHDISQRQAEMLRNMTGIELNL